MRFEEGVTRGDERDEKPDKNPCGRPMSTSAPAFGCMWTRRWRVTDVPRSILLPKCPVHTGPVPHPTGASIGWPAESTTGIDRFHFFVTLILGSLGGGCDTPALPADSRRFVTAGAEYHLVWRVHREEADEAGYVTQAVVSKIRV